MSFVCIGSCEFRISKIVETCCSSCPEAVHVRKIFDIFRQLDQISSQGLDFLSYGQYKLFHLEGRVWYLFIWLFFELGPFVDWISSHWVPTRVVPQSVHCMRTNWGGKFLKKEKMKWKWTANIKRNATGVPVTQTREHVIGYFAVSFFQSEPISCKSPEILSLFHFFPSLPHFDSEIST